MRLSAVSACIRVISEGVASLPLKVYERKKEGRVTASDLPLYYRLHDEPNEFMTSFTFRNTIQSQTCKYGNGYALIKRSGLRDAELEYVPTELVEPKVERGQPLSYKIDGVMVAAADVFHLPALTNNGIEGLSPITEAKEVIKLGLSAEVYTQTFFEKGGHWKGFLEHPGRLSDTAYKRLKESFFKSYHGLNNAFETPLLEEGAKYTSLNMNPQEAQLLEMRKFVTTEICRIFRVQPHLVFDLERATNNNIEHQSLEFVQYTLRPWLIRWEQELNRKLFGPKSKYYCEFDLNGLMRADAASRGEYIAKLIQNGVMSPNEARRMDNMNGYEGGDEYFIQGATVPINMAGQQNKKSDGAGA
jgi:HK97 family phage portal protein